MLAIEGQLPEQHFKQCDTEGPDVNFFTVVFLVKDLGSHRNRSTTVFLDHFIVSDLGGKTEICKFDKDFVSRVCFSEGLCEPLLNIVNFSEPNILRQKISIVL